MNIKKIVAGALAGAMVVGCMILPSSAAVNYTSEVTGVTGTITYEVASNTWFDATDTWGTVVYQDWSTGTTTVDGAYATLTDGSTVDLTLGFEDPTYSVVIIGGSEISDYTEVASVTFEVTYDGTEYNDDSTWIGGCIGISSLSVSWWSTIEWGKASGDKPIAIEDSITGYVYTVAIEISESDLENDSYVVTLSNADGDEGEVSGNTYYVEDSKYYIGIEVTDVPVDQTIDVETVEFVESN